MGQQIAAATQDDLLAAWLSMAETWFCRTTATDSQEYRQQVNLEEREAELRARVEWRESGGDRIPLSTRQQIQGALERADAALARLDRAAVDRQAQAWKSWRECSNWPGSHPAGFYSRNGVRPRSPIEDCWELDAALERGREEFDAVMVCLRSEIHEAALVENERRDRVCRPALPEARYLQAVHAAAHDLLRRTTAEGTRGEERAMGWAGSPAIAEHEWRILDTAAMSLDHGVTKALEKAGDWAALADRLWDGLAEGYDLTDLPLGSTARPEPAAFTELVELSHEIAAGHESLDHLLGEHRRAVHSVALRTNRRFDWSRTGNAVDLNGIGQLHHRDFERLVADLLSRDGFTIEQRTGGAGDLGADVIGVDDVTGHRAVLQCKHTARQARVGTPELQRFKGTVWDVHKADVAVVVTNGAFTRHAVSFAREHNITLLDSRGLWEWAHLGDSFRELRRAQPPAPRIRRRNRIGPDFPNCP